MYSIYKIQNVNTLETYIGSSPRPVIRWEQHLKRLRKGIHNSKFQNSWNKSSLTDWIFSIIEIGVSKEKILLTEQKWIDTIPKEQSLNILSPTQMIKKIKAEKKAQVIDLINQGKTYREISKKLNISLGSVSNISKESDFLNINKVDSLNRTPNDHTTESGCCCSKLTDDTSDDAQSPYPER